jgi:hypothetical protein
LQDQGEPWALKGLSRADKGEVLDHLLEQEVLAKAAGRWVLGACGEAAFDNPLWRQTGKTFWRPARYVARTGKSLHAASMDAWFLEAFPKLVYLQAEQLWQVGDVRGRAGVVDVLPARGAEGPCWLGSLRVYHPRFGAEIRALLFSDSCPGFLENRQLQALKQLREQWKPRLVRSSAMQLITFAGARVNGAIAKLHHLLTGEMVAFNNLLVEATGSSQGLRPTLQRLLDGLSPDDEQGLVDSCRHEPLIDYLPARIKTRYLTTRLFDLDGARAVAARIAQEEAVEERRPLAVRDVGPDYQPEAVSGDAFFQQLVHLARSQTTRNKWVFLPEVGLQWVLSERLLHAGVDWVNFRFHTPFQVALELAAPYLVQAGVHPKPEGLGPELVAKLLLQLPKDEEGYFRPLADQGGIARPLWKAVHELRMAGLTCASLKMEMFTTAAKGREMKALLGAYERYLEQHHLGDRATVFRAALERLNEGPVGEGDLVVEYPCKPWSALERAFLDGLGGVSSPTWVTQNNPPRRWPLLCPRQEQRPRVITCDSHLLGLLSSGRAPAAKNDGTLQFFCAGRRDSEVQEVLRRVLERARPLDQVEIVVHDPDSLALLWDKLQKHGLPATFQDGLPVSATTPGRAVLGLLQWSEANFASFFLRELLLAGLLQVEGCTPSAGARHLERAQTTWGRDTYALQLGRLETRCRVAAVRPEEAQSRTEQADSVSAFGQWVEQLLARWPVAGADGGLDLAGLVDGMLCTLENHIPLRSPLDRVARGFLCRAFRDLKLLADAPWTREGCHRLVREKLESLTVGTGRPEAGKLFVTSPLKMGRTGRPFLFLLGLEATGRESRSTQRLSSPPTESWKIGLGSGNSWAVLMAR